eukprot:6809158-Prymnesium_polylepis.2
MIGVHHVVLAKRLTPRVAPHSAQDAPAQLDGRSSHNRRAGDDVGMRHRQNRLERAVGRPQVGLRRVAQPVGSEHKRLGVDEEAGARWLGEREAAVHLLQTLQPVAGHVAFWAREQPRRPFVFDGRQRAVERTMQGCAEGAHVHGGQRREWAQLCEPAPQQRQATRKVAVLIVARGDRVVRGRREAAGALIVIAQDGRSERRPLTEVARERRRDDGERTEGIHHGPMRHILACGSPRRHECGHEDLQVWRAAARSWPTFCQCGG